MFDVHSLRKAALVDEPILELSDIQGNIVHGFNKSCQRLLGLKVTDRAAARAWLRAMVPEVTTAAEVHAFRTLRKMMIRRQGRESGELAAVWANVAFSAPGLRALARQPADVDAFEDEAFRVGLAARSSSLGDPPDVLDREGSPKKWLVGGTPEKTPDILLIVAADRLEQLDDKVRSFKDGLAGLNCIYEERGEDLPGLLAGHEHFGFKDGISQPGVRGRAPDPPHEFLTPRRIHPDDSLSAYFASPGEPLIRPGQFVFGYDTQDPLTGGIGRRPGAPEWAKNGSFLVYRRLRQDVGRFWGFMTTKAAELAAKPGFEGLTAERLAALLVGRWPSGAPVARTPLKDDPALARDWSNNYFQFANASRFIPPAPGTGLDPDKDRLAPADGDGFVCPGAAHIRKVNPRDLTTEQLGGMGDTFTRRILRRGIPFGPVLADPQRQDNDPARGNRGLLFISYQTSIADQFEFLARTWMDRPREPEAHGGMDLVVGQNGEGGPDRTRQCPLRFKGTGGTVQATLATDGDWIIPTGGGYFFAPSVTALREELSG